MSKNNWGRGKHPKPGKLWSWVGHIGLAYFGLCPNGAVDVPKLYDHLEDLHKRLATLEEARLRELEDHVGSA